MESISIVVPNFNHAAELKISLKAIVSQSRPAEEIIVVDDCSTDDSVAVIEGFARKTPAIRMIRNRTRSGVAASVNRGVQEAVGDHVILASADEMIQPDMCATLALAVRSFPDAKMAVSVYAEWRPETNTVRVHGPESELGMWYAPSETSFFVSPELLHDLLKRSFVWLGANTAIFRRDALLEVGGFDPALEWFSDWFAMYALAFRHGFCAVPRSLSWFRVSPTSYSAQGMRHRRAQEKVVVAIQRKLRSEEFKDIGAAVVRSPVVMSTFIRPTILALAKRPGYYPVLVRILRWWFGQFLHGRRPLVWSRLVFRGVRRE